jgi:hypothetical protein
MKYIVFLLSFLVIQTVSALDYSVGSTSDIPSWFTPDATATWYTNASSPDRYKVISSSPSPGWGVSRKEWTWPDLSNDTNITNNQISNEKFKSGDLTLNDIPLFISGIIQFILGIAGTLSIVALIYHAVHMQIYSGITWDSSKVETAKKWMYGALMGFVVTILAWFIVTRVIEILISIT